MIFLILNMDEVSAIYHEITTKILKEAMWNLPARYYSNQFKGIYLFVIFLYKKIDRCFRLPQFIVDLYSR